MEAYIKGHFRKSIYSNESGYTIGIFKVKETNDDELDVYVDRTITFTGYFHDLNENDLYVFHGKLVNHEKYGEQFAVNSYERVEPEDKDSIVEFLTSGLFKGIGEAKAKKIVDRLGKDTLKVIIDNPSSLILIPTITEKNASTLHNKMLEYNASYETIIYLNDLGFTTKESMLIYNYYKDKTREVLDKNIYRIVEDIRELYFKRVDTVAVKAGVDTSSVLRIKAAILYIMRELTNSFGHSYFFYEEIYSFIPRVIGISVSDSVFDESLDRLIKDIDIIVVDDKYYLKDMYEAETLIVKRINILSHKKDKKSDILDKKIEYLEQYFDIKYNSEQQDAIKKSYLKDFLIITGGPGTGKTTIMRSIIELYREMNKYSSKDMKEKVALLAPTGRAAKRMSESALMGASTIHRFLGWHKESDKFEINEYNKSKVEFVIIDEASMIDTYLMSSLLKGLRADTKIIMVGDAEQLPSVGPGNMLNDLITSGKTSVVELKELYRQGKDSNIITFAYDIRCGELNTNVFNARDDLTLIECNNFGVLDNIKDILEKYKNKNYKNFQILAPMYKTVCGIDAINKVGQEIVNKKSSSKKEILVGETIYREKDKVIQLTNMPDDNVYNGDIGIIEKITLKPRREIEINFDGNIVKYTQASFNKFKLAYAISIHKAQGSEADIIVIPIVNNFNKMLYRKLIYTGVTRAKKKLYLLGEVSAIKRAITNTNSDIRRTTIKDFLINGIK